MSGLHTEIHCLMVLRDTHDQGAHSVSFSRAVSSTFPQALPIPCCSSVSHLLPAPPMNVGVHAYVYMQILMHVCAHRGQRTTSVSFHRCHPHFLLLLRKSLSLAQSPPSKLSWLVRPPLIGPFQAWFYFLIYVLGIKPQSFTN